MRCPTLNDLPPPPGKTGWPWTDDSPRAPDAMSDGLPWPCVTIVTPSYNQGQFIEETIRSVLLQGYPELEYIITDGGSTDESLSVIRKYERWLAYWVSEPDRGQTHAINKGWERAHGEILAYLNSDDLLTPGALNCVAGTWRMQPKAAVIYGDFDLVDETSRLIKTLCSRPYRRADLLPANYIPQSSTFIRRCAAEQVGPLDESFHMTMDYEYWVRLAMAGFEMLYVPQVLSAARISPIAKTSRLTVQFLSETLRVLDATYSLPNLPDDVRSVKRSAYGSVWRLGGIRYFDAGLRSLAIRAMLSSLRWDPLPGLKPLAVSLAIILQSILGVHWRSAHTLEKMAP